MRLSHAVSAAALIAIAAAAACSGGQSTNYVAPPSAGGAISAGGPVVLSQTATVESAGTANGITGALTFGAGTGTVTSVASATAPFGTPVVVPAAKQRVVLAVATASPTSPNVYYVTITSPTGATLAGLPGVSLSLSSAAVGTFQEAEYTGAAWTNVSGAISTVSPSGMGVSFAALSTPITIAANGSIYLAFYQGNYPNATPTPLATPVNVIADSGFESGAAAAYGSAVSSTGWTQCSITKSAAGASPPHPLSKYTPVPGTTPAAVIAKLGSSLQVGSDAPHPTQTTVPVVDGSYAAVFGTVFSNYYAEDFLYNGLCQTVKVPQSPTISMSIFANGNDGKSYMDFEVNALDTTGAFLGNIYVDSNDPITGTSAGDTAYRSINVPTGSLQPYAGQTIQLFVGAWIDAGSSSGATYYSTYYFLDDFELMGIVSGS